MNGYKEILRLKEMLNGEDIPYDFEEYEGGYHLTVPDCRRPDFSIIEHDYSFGHEADLLEIMENIQDGNDGNDVEGYLTAEDVIERIREFYMG